MIPRRVELVIKEKLNILYKEDINKWLYNEIENKIKKFIDENEELKNDHRWVNEKDIFLITYGDSIISKGMSPIESLTNFSIRYLDQHIKNIHLLPFFPYSSDDGFSVIDYYKVDSQLGNWKDIEKLNKHFELMFDGVINHISRESKWFREYLLGNTDYKNYFIEAEACEALKKVTRPRTKSLLNTFETKMGEKRIWTTFSKDQIDLNYKSEKVLLEIIDVIMFYASKGARFLRLDAIGYLWKEIGTTCIHLEETHTVIQLFREILNVIAPATVLITETNVAHKENISYFGNGVNEAQMVYQFPLPPLVLHGIHNGTGDYLSVWARKLELKSNRTTFFNFLASHDGIGLMPVKDILPEKDVEALIHRIEENGGLVSYKNNSDGSKSAYELNVSYFDALAHKGSTVDRFILAQSILLSIIGVPAIYIHSLLGSQNDYKGVKKTGRNRTINRESLDRNRLISEIEDERTIRHRIYNQYIELIKIRKKEKCFHPNAKMRVVDVDSRVFAYKRVNENETILVLNNLSRDKVYIENNDKLLDIISREVEKGGEIELKPYQMKWLKKVSL